jgi:DNA modification methylase
MRAIEEIHIPDVVREVLPAGYSLLPGINQIYELELALAEFRSLDKEDLLKRGAYYKTVDGEETYHYQLCVGAPLRIDKSSSIRLRTFFQAYQFKTGYATHGLFPYRGKFHPQLIKAILNVIGVQTRETILDPMTGSGTLNTEASILGINSIGIDTSPFCCLMSEAKAGALALEADAVREYESKPNKVLTHFHKSRDKLSSLDKDRKREVFGNPVIEKLFELCYLDTMGYARRRANKSIEELFPIVFDKYVHAVLNFIEIRNRLGLELGKVTIALGDARNMREMKSGQLPRIEDGSIDAIVTSPPYSFAINYLDGDEPQLEFMGYDVDTLKASMVGLRGRTMVEKVRNYLKDMDTIFAEMSRVLRQRKYAVIVIGSNVIQLERTLQSALEKNDSHGLDDLQGGISLEDAYVRISSRHGFNLVQRFSHPIEGVRNALRTEEILFLRRT